CTVFTMLFHFNAIVAIAFRDLTKLFRDRIRLVASFVFPFMFIGVLGGGLNASFGDRLGFQFLPFVFVGVLAQTMFQSSAAGVISLIRDRETDFSKELFVAPISRYGIVLGKIIGESLVSLTQGVGIVAFGLIIGVPITLAALAAMAPVAFISALFGGAFGILVLGNVREQRTTAQLFPFLIFPQFILAGVFNPIKDLPPVAAWLSRITPMTYPVDLMRGVFYSGSTERVFAVSRHPLANITIIVVLFGVFLLLGTWLFVRKERER
ncbi:MAG: ABC transporter permease, partial [Patescibacteria group bacterium]|nr:ABC transporter permease [Patescibacteria group bacterium]